MAEISLPWGGQSTGDCGPYTDADWTSMYRDLFTVDHHNSGVLPTWGSFFAATKNGSQVTVGTGVAMVDGKYYQNQDPNTYDFATEGYYRIVLRKTWTTQTVRMAVLGPSPSSYPGFTRSGGNTWEIPLYRVLSNVSGVTVTDERVIIPYIQTPQRHHGYSATDYTQTVGTPDLRIPINPTVMTGYNYVEWAALSYEVSKDIYFGSNNQPFFFTPPLVFVTLSRNNGIDGVMHGIVPATYTDRFTIHVRSTTQKAVGYRMWFQFMAIGPHPDTNTAN